MTTADRPVISALDEHPPAVPNIVVVGGAGHVGLPLSLVLCEAGFRVGIFDTSRQALETIASGRAPFDEPGTDELIDRLAATGRLTFSASPDHIRGVETVIVAVGLPDNDGASSVGALDQTIDGIAAYLEDGALLIIRSTVRPGTTEHVRKRLRELGKRADVVFCPERLIQGNALDELRSLPQIVGADDPQAASRAEALFGRLGIECLRSSPLEAEVAKLVANGWRYVSFAAANEFWALADAAGADYENVLHIVQQDYPRARSLPSPGFAGGPCLVKDSVALAGLSSLDGSLVRAALDVNRSLPARVTARMETRFGSLAGRRIGLLGMSFKAGSDDMRGAPSTDLRRLLIDTRAIVLSTDPYVSDPANLPIAEVLERSEIIVIATPHPDYRGIDIPADRLVDIWGITRAGIVA
ncbi:MAG TPA: nucleotide sugar dehydrogenase [Candidatus Limnocylindrales bacterium]|nr:nucleotide sugar dehydrogenase [Candidatus Limnocylindrales bacterium]